MQSVQLCPPPIRDFIASARKLLAEGGMRADELSLGAEAAELTGALTEDAVLATAVLAKPVLGQANVTPASLVRLVGGEAIDVAVHLSRLGELGLPRDWQPAHGLSAQQAETLRKMLLAVVSDPRLVIARLAEQLVQLRHARELPPAQRERLAIETRAVFAPLANRLGVWQLKWELEDLAFRYLEPDEYRSVATALSERRADRELYIERLCAELRQQLLEHGIDADIHGRPKHMYSIFRKMQRKQLAFGQLFDVRAVRIIVATIPDCYAALGVVHGRWPYLAGEFDDYIATPKGNAYRSIHTAVLGPGGKSVEVQIRTREMHEQAELGVAAHWTYKEGRPRDLQYERKIEWARRLLDLQESVGDGSSDFLDSMRSELFDDRVYALTPKGEIIDLPSGATPLDFAYHVHTSLGHRCRGAKVNGRIVPLAHTLRNGEIVEIIAARDEAPSRDWLAPEAAYLASPRSRAKVRAWFRKQNAADNRDAGRAIAERELARLGADAAALAPLIGELAARDSEHLYQLLGEGEITATQLVQAAQRVLGQAGRRATPPADLRPNKRISGVAHGSHRRSSSLVDIEGVGNLPITLARCCAPLRPQSISGYVTVGRGVTIHRRECPGLQRMRAARPERVLNVDWAASAAAPLTVALEVDAFDRHGLVRDLTDVLAVERLNIEAMTTTTDRGAGAARVTITLAVADLEQLTRILRRLAAVPSVIHARRSG